jgi:hypothetical protein
MYVYTVMKGESGREGKIERERERERVKECKDRYQMFSR